MESPPSKKRVLQKSGDRRGKFSITDILHKPESAAGNEFQKKFKLNLMEKFECVSGIMKQENPTLLNEIYTELYITKGNGGDVKEHEVSQIEAAHRRKTTTEETPIACNDIFKCFSKEDKPIRTVLTKGVAGIGKTFSMQKFILDWAEGKANQDVPLICPLPFRELNLLKDQKMSLMDLLHVRFWQINGIQMRRLEKVLFIFDGLDECRFPLYFLNSQLVYDISESAPVPALLINLIRGNLLPSALVWITSRPAATDQIPPGCVDRVTEVRGFNDPQKEEYFRKRISDQSQANNIITHLKSLRSLDIMCHIPVFCWISATVLERLLSEAESGEIPKTLTQIYTHFLIIQIKDIKEKYVKKEVSDEEMLLKLGHLAFQQLEKGNFIFYEEDLKECGINVTEAAMYSGVCTEIFREEFHQRKPVYYFVHLSIQEQLAALYVHMTSIKEKRNVIVQGPATKKKDDVILDVHKCVVNQALKSKTGHLDLFLRFLLGLSLDSNQKLLHALVSQTGIISQSEQKILKYVKDKISNAELPAEKSINLFHCLNELGDDSLMEEIQQYLQSDTQSKLSPLQWSALVYVLLTSAQGLEEFNPSKYTTEKITDEILVRVMPVIAASRKAIISCDRIIGSSGAALGSLLDSETSSLTELHLTVKTLYLNIKPKATTVKHLCAVLHNPHCKVETVWLEQCITGKHFAAICAALSSNPSHLRELHLRSNNLGDSGVNCVSSVLEDPQCKLEILGLYQCVVTGNGCAALASALRSNPSHLRELHLSSNSLGDSGVKSLSVALENPHCKLETLWLQYCEVSDEGCAALASALRSNPSHLRRLNLRYNKITDSGKKLLSALRDDENYKLQTLWF